jgi:hypothetical protein
MLSRVILVGAVFLGSAALSNAAPLDTPDTVYIDGTPCNSACQSYMAWSRHVLSSRQAQTPRDAARRRAARTSATKPRSAARDRVAKQAAATAPRTREDKIARVHQPGASALPAPANKPADTASRAAPDPATPTAATPTAAAPSAVTPTPVIPTPVISSPANPSVVNPSAVEKPAEQTAGLQQPSLAAPSNSTINAAPAAEPSANAGDAGTKTTAVQDQVIAATVLAEQLTSSATARPELHAMNGEFHNGAAIPADSNVAASPNASDALVALVMSRPEIKSVADLAGRNVAIDGQRSGSANDVRTALVAAGAGEVQLSIGDAKAVDRLVDGEVPAAVLTLVSSDAAKTFPEIAGYNVFRIPLSPGSSK